MSPEREKKKKKKKGVSTHVLPPSSPSLQLEGEGRGGPGRGSQKGESKRGNLSSLPERRKLKKKKRERKEPSFGRKSVGGEKEKKRGKTNARLVPQSHLPLFSVTGGDRRGKVKKEREGTTALTKKEKKKKKEMAEKVAGESSLRYLLPLFYYGRGKGKERGEAGRADD